MAGEARRGGTGQGPHGEGGSGPVSCLVVHGHVCPPSSPRCVHLPRGPLSAPIVGNEAWLHRETQTPTTAIRTLVIQITLRDVQHHELDLGDKLIFHLPEGATPVEFSRVQFPNWSS